MGKGRRGGDTSRDKVATTIKAVLLGAGAAGFLAMMAKELPGLIREVKIWRM
jgi:hypothetical protein